MTTPINALPYPNSSSPNNPPIHFQALNNQLDTRLVPRFATATARNSAITSPVEGMVCVVAGYPQVYRSGAWRGIQSQLISTTTVDTGLKTGNATLMTLSIPDPQCAYKIQCSAQIIFGVVGPGVTAGGRIRVNGTDLIVGNDAINASGSNMNNLLTTIPAGTTGTMTGAATVSVFVSMTGPAGYGYQATASGGLGLYNILSALVVPV